MTWLENVVFKDQELDNTRLELSDKNTLYFLSTGLTLRRCTIVLKVPASRLVIKQARFIDCTFEVKQELKNHQSWLTASLKGCRFKGRLTGCDFGHWPEYSSDPWYQHGSIEDCDFSEARLQGCRFHGCDPTTLRFPVWPCFTFLDPVAHAPELNRATWPGRVGRVAIESLSDEPPTTRALTEDALALGKRLEATPEQLRAVLERFACVVL